MNIDWTITGIVINAILVLFSGAIGVMVASMNGKLSRFEAAVISLQAADANMAGKIAAVEILVAGQYVRREEFKESLARELMQIQRDLQRLEARVDGFTKT